MNFNTLYEILKEKGTNPLTKDKPCIEVAPRTERDYDLFTYQYNYQGENVVFSYNQVGKKTYKEMLELVELFIKQQSYLRDMGAQDELNYIPLTICKKVYLDYIAIFIANLKLHRIPVLFPLELDEIDFNEFKKYNHFFSNNPADFYIFSSGSTGLLNKPKPAYEKDLINSIYYDFMIKNHVENEKFYSTMSMNGIAGVTFNAFFPIVTNNSIYINDNKNFFENIFYTKSTMFILPLNYMDFLPLNNPNCNDYSHVKHILISGGYFNTKDLDNLFKNLPGLKKETINYLYSSTELEGKSIASTYDELYPVKVSMPDLLKNKVSFCDNLDSTEYLSSGKVDDKWKIVSDNKILGEDELGIITYNNHETDDIGFIHQNRLYVVGRKPDNDTYNLSIISNYFRYHLNNDVVCGIYNGELVVYVDIINNYYSAYAKELMARRGIYQSYIDNFNLKDKANALIKHLEDNYDIEFYGDALLHKFIRNERLEKILFNYQYYNPFDQDINNTNGARLFDTYYFISSHFENIFLLDVLFMLYNNIPSEEYYNGEEFFKHMPLDRIYNAYKRIYENQELIDRINNTPVVHEYLKELLRMPAFLSLDFNDMHHFDKDHSDETAEELMNGYNNLPELNKEQKDKVRNLIAIFRELQVKLHIDIHDKEYYSDEYANKRNERVKNFEHPFLTLFEEISHGKFDGFIAVDMMNNEKGDNYEPKKTHRLFRRKGKR